MTIPLKRRFDFGANPEFNGAGLWRVQENHLLAETALRWTTRLNVPPVEIFVAPFGKVPQMTYAVFEPHYGDGLPGRAVRLAEMYYGALSDGELDAALAHEVGHIAMEHGRTRFFMRANARRNHTCEYQADGIATYLTSGEALIGALMAMSPDHEGSESHPATRRRIERVRELGDLQRAPSILEWIGVHVRA